MVMWFLSKATIILSNLSKKKEKIKLLLYLSCLSIVYKKSCFFLGPSSVGEFSKVFLSIEVLLFLCDYARENMSFTSYLSKQSYMVLLQAMTLVQLLRPCFLPFLLSKPAFCSSIFFYPRFYSSISLIVPEGEVYLCLSCLSFCRNICIFFTWIDTILQVKILSDDGCQSEATPTTTFHSQACRRWHVSLHYLFHSILIYFMRILNNLRFCITRL